VLLQYLIHRLIAVDRPTNRLFLMLDDILNNPGLAKYLTRFQSDQIIFLEGDDSQELYVLVSGRIAIFKGDKKIRGLSKTGSIFGEMSFFLGGSRTASIRTIEDVSVLRIPREEINNFLAEFPDAAREITRHLAQWLAETTQIVYGLKEFCDQLPDAVILTDRTGKILTWNSRAETLYGRSGEQMRTAKTADIYEDAAAYKNFLEQVQRHYSVKENVLKIMHPQKGTRFISTSMTVLHDGHHNFQGVLSLGRDVSRTKKLEKKYKRAGYWLTAVVLLLGLMTAAVVVGYPYYSKDYQIHSLKRDLMQEYLVKDYFILKSLLSEHLASENRLETSAIMKDFFIFLKKTDRNYTGIVLLDSERIVFDAYSIDPEADTGTIVGNSYSAIEFEGSDTSLHKVLTLYRADKNHPTGKKGVEIAFELQQNGKFIGWLIFQMDMDQLKKNLGIELQDLKKLQIEKP
jgi:PAS domain S-box-containing protein